MVVQSHECSVMKVAFRADASIQIGTGHVMRCLTLADELRARGSECIFICREHQGNLIEQLRRKGYTTFSLAIENEADNDLPHSPWLGATQRKDADACTPILAKFQPDWLIVDHYALDYRWEHILASHCGALMVIDDLADRKHCCRILLDQTYGRSADDYRPLVPDDCEVLCGCDYALLRPEFAENREYSLKRRVHPQLKSILVTLGGVDRDNITSKVLFALSTCKLPDDCNITVIMGPTAPFLTHVQQQAHTMPRPTNVCVDVNNMAQLMADSDLAIGAAGSTSWERCCLGLPTITLVLANNQKWIARGLSQVGAVLTPQSKDFSQDLKMLMHVINEKILINLSQTSAKITDGLGASRVSNFIFNRVKHANQLALQR